MTLKHLWILLILLWGGGALIYGQDHSFSQLNRGKDSLLSKHHFLMNNIGLTNTCSNKVTTVLNLSLSKDIKMKFSGVGDFHLTVDKNGRVESVKIVSIEIKEKENNRFFDWVIFMKGSLPKTIENVGASINDLDDYRLDPSTRNIVYRMLEVIKECVVVSSHMDFENRKYVYAFFSF